MYARIHISTLINMLNYYYIFVITKREKREGNIKKERIYFKTYIHI